MQCSNCGKELQVVNQKLHTPPFCFPFRSSFDLLRHAFMLVKSVRRIISFRISQFKPFFIFLPCARLWCGYHTRAVDEWVCSMARYATASVTSIGVVTDCVQLTQMATRRAFIYICEKRVKQWPSKNCSSGLMKIILENKLGNVCRQFSLQTKATKFFLSEYIIIHCLQVNAQKCCKTVLPNSFPTKFRHAWSISMQTSISV